MGKFNLSKRLTSAKPMENGLMWYECAGYGEAKEYIKGNLQKIQENFVSVGYWLKYVRDNRMYAEDGYKSIEEFAQAAYSISKSTAYRLMEINTSFSKNGNSPELAEEYKGFSKSQLQELLALTDSQREEATPEMTVDEIRQIKKENQPDDDVIRRFCKICLSGRIEKQNYLNTKILKEYMHDKFGKSHLYHGSSDFSLDCNPRGIVFSLKRKVYDEMTWAVLSKRIIELYKIDPSVLEQPEVLDGQMEIVNVGMEVKEFNGRQDSFAEPKEESQCEEAMLETDGAVKEKDKIQEPENPEEEQDSVPLQESYSEESKKPHQHGCITGANPYGNCVCCGSEGVQCCAECKKDCNGRCGWYQKNAAEKEDDSQGEVSFSEIPDEGTEPAENAEPEVSILLSYNPSNLKDCFPQCFTNLEQMFYFDSGKCRFMTMELQKYIASQINELDLSKYRIEIRAVKIGDR